MAPPRLKTEIWVQAHLRRCTGEGVYALVARKGDPDAGAIAVKVYLGAGRARLFVQSRDLDGAVIWRNPFTEDNTEDQWAEETRIDQWLAKEALIDPDLWVIEIEDRQGRAFLDDV